MSHCYWRNILYNVCLHIILGCAPAPEEVLLAVRVTENKIALKSGYNKYLKVCSDNVVRGISDAVGATEQWEPIFQVLCDYEPGSDLTY